MVIQEIGKQYKKDSLIDKTGFLEKARLHQSKYRAYELKAPYDGYGNYLTKEDALNGLNFYNDFNIFDEVKNRYPRYSSPLYANLLRSEHISFNLFIPFKHDLIFCKNVFNLFLNNQIKSIERIEIEYAPSPASKYLNDKTSFDAYIEYQHIDNSMGIIGIEVKYTEHEYKLKKGSKQEADILNKESKYYKVSNACKLYKSGSINALISDQFRQVWRNQLLGESIIIEDNEKFKHFSSLTMFPKSNTHFIETSEKYISMLTKNTGKFIPVTYEEFIHNCRTVATDMMYAKWLDYLEKRYLITEI
jgi:hypothetical protein